MKRILPVLLVSALLSLGACSGNEDTAPVVESTPTVSVDDAFTDHVRTAAPELSDVSDPTLIDFAGTMCDFFDAGGNPLDAFAVGRQSGLGDKSVAVLISSSVSFYCNEHGGKFA